MDRAAAIILAAGGATRFGSAKQLARIGSESLIRRAVRCCLDAELSPVIVVVGAYEAAVQKEVESLPVTVCANPEWRVGLGTSIVRGVAEAIEHGATSLAIVLADQPLITPVHLRDLHQQRRRADAPVAATAYSGTLGAPAVFDARMFPTLLCLEPDRGAGSLIRACESRVEVPFAGAALDIDTPADLADLPPS